MAILRIELPFRAFGPAACFVGILLSFPSLAIPRTAWTSSVAGIASDVNGARISNATVIFRGKIDEFTAKTKYDGTFALELQPGIYSMEVRSAGFCALRRAAFVLHKREAIQFDLQMWVCPSDMVFVQYAELEEVAHTHLKPLVQYGKQNVEGKVEKFGGPIDLRQYSARNGSQRLPVIFTFNHITVSADEIMYDIVDHTVTARANVSWQDGRTSGKGTKLELKLDGLNPRLVPLAE